MTSLLNIATRVTYENTARPLGSLMKRSYWLYKRFIVLGKTLASILYIKLFTYVVIRWNTFYVIFDYARGKQMATLKLTSVCNTAVTYIYFSWDVSYEKFSRNLGRIRDENLVEGREAHRINSKFNSIRKRVKNSTQERLSLQSNSTVAWYFAFLGKTDLTKVTSWEPPNVS